MWGTGGRWGGQNTDCRGSVGEAFGGRRTLRGHSGAETLGLGLGGRASLSSGSEGLSGWNETGKDVALGHRVSKGRFPKQTLR